MVLVKNPTKRPITVVVTHADAPKTDVAFQQVLHDPASGELTDRRIERRLPESITLFGGEERDLPGYAKREALAAGLVIVKQEKPSEGTQAPEPKPKDAEALPNALKRKRGSE